MRRSALLSAGLGVSLLVSLVACAPADDSESSTSETTSSTECVTSGAASDAVSVEGGVGSVPTVTFDGPLSAEVTQRTVVEEGDGEVATEGDALIIEYAVFNGDSGVQLANTGFTGEASERFVIKTGSAQLSGFSQLLNCASVGSRVAGVVPPAAGFGEAGVPELGLAGTESLVFVIDLVSMLPPALERAEGTAQEAPAGFPTVELAENGAPTITLPEGDPVATFELALLIKGEGSVVEDGQIVTVHYTGVNWNTGEVFDSSWERGAPVDFPTDGVIPGFTDALVGQTVGSQVIVIIPPELGYGPSGGTPDGSIGPDDVIVFVIDILAAS